MLQLHYLSDTYVDQPDICKFHHIWAICDLWTKGQYVFLGEHLKLFWQLFYCNFTTEFTYFWQESPHTWLQCVRYGYVNE